MPGSDADPRARARRAARPAACPLRWIVRPAGRAAPRRRRGAAGIEHGTRESAAAAFAFDADVAWGGRVHRDEEQRDPVFPAGKHVTAFAVAGRAVEAARSERDLFRREPQDEHGGGVGCVRAAPGDAARRHRAGPPSGHERPGASYVLSGRGCPEPFQPARPPSTGPDAPRCMPRLPCRGDRIRRRARDRVPAPAGNRDARQSRSLTT